MAANPATETALLDAAKRLIAERGFAQVTVREIADAAGANVAAVNYHYGSRERLLTKAVLEVFLEWTDEVSREVEPDRASGGSGTDVQKLVRGLSRMLDGAAAHEPQFATVLEAILQSRRSPELRGELASHYAEQRRRIGAMVQGGATPHEVPQRLESIMASMLIAITDGLLLQLILDPAAVPSGAELRRLVGADSTREEST